MLTQLVTNKPCEKQADDTASLQLAVIYNKNKTKDLDAFLSAISYLWFRDHTVLQSVNLIEQPIYSSTIPAAQQPVYNS